MEAMETQVIIQVPVAQMQGGEDEGESVVTAEQATLVQLHPKEEVSDPGFGGELEDEAAGEVDDVKNGDNELDGTNKFDTTEEYNQIFGDAPEFDSWEEFTKCLEQFQIRTKTCFKPRSACSIDYANERRIKCPIPDRFVYANVKMICQHYGTWSKRGGGQKRDYVGKGCNAFMNVGFNRGALRITQKNLIHNNHDQIADSDQTPSRSLRIFSFTEEADMMMLREVLRLNPFAYANGEKQWISAVENLKNDDDMFTDLTPRLVKKRVRFLIDKFLAITHGRRPPKEDEMGVLLYDLHKAKKDAIDGVLAQNKKKGKRGRPRKRPLSDDELEEDDELVSDEPNAVSRYAPPKSSSKSTPSADITQLITYLEKKDEEDRQIRQKQWEEDRRMRLRELELRKQELAYQKERFEFEKLERKEHTEVIKAQLQAFEQSVLSKQAGTIATAKEGVTEYTIVVDNNNPVLQSLPIG